MKLLHINNVRPQLYALHQLEVIDQAANNFGIRLLKVIEVHFDVYWIVLGAKEKSLPEVDVSNVV